MKLAAVVAVALAVICGEQLANGQAPPDLFAEIDANQVLASLSRERLSSEADAADRHHRMRYVTLDSKLLNQIQALRYPAKQTINLNLFDGVSFIAELGPEPKPGYRVWAGSIPQVTGSSVFLAQSVQPGLLESEGVDVLNTSPITDLHGSVAVFVDLYSIRPVYGVDAIYAVVHINRTGFRCTIEEPPQ